MQPEQLAFPDVGRSQQLRRLSKAPRKSGDVAYVLFPPLRRHIPDFHLINHSLTQWCHGLLSMVWISPNHGSERGGPQCADCAHVSRNCTEAQLSDRSARNNGGVTWTHASRELGSLSVNDITDPRYHPIYLATDRGVLVEK